MLPGGFSTSLAVFEASMTTSSPRSQNAAGLSPHNFRMSSTATRRIARPLMALQVAAFGVGGLGHWGAGEDWEGGGQNLSIGEVGTVLPTCMDEMGEGVKLATRLSTCVSLLFFFFRCCHFMQDRRSPLNPTSSVPFIPPPPRGCQVRSPLQR